MRLQVAFDPTVLLAQCRYRRYCRQLFAAASKLKSLGVIIDNYLGTSFSHYTPPLLWAVVSAVVAFLTLGAHVFIVLVHMLCFLCFLVVMCFPNKLMIR